jgi:hypothetical protein
MKGHQGYVRVDEPEVTIESVILTRTDTAFVRLSSPQLSVWVDPER